MAVGDIIVLHVLARCGECGSSHTIVDPGLLVQQCSVCAMVWMVDEVGRLRRAPEPRSLSPTRLRNPDQVELIPGTLPGRDGHVR